MVNIYCILFMLNESNFDFGFSSLTSRSDLIKYKPWIIVVRVQYWSIFLYWQNQVFDFIAPGKEAKLFKVDTKSFWIPVNISWLMVFLCLQNQVFSSCPSRITFFISQNKLVLMSFDLLLKLPLHNLKSQGLHLNETC